MVMHKEVKKAFTLKLTRDELKAVEEILWDMIENKMDWNTDYGNMRIAIIEELRIKVGKKLFDCPEKTSIKLTKYQAIAYYIGLKNGMFNGYNDAIAGKHKMQLGGWIG